jgi:SAM-dependent methyltransferase
MSSPLPFIDGSFDLVIVSASLHHAPNWESTLRQIAAVLRTGGRAIIVNEPVEGTLKHVGRARTVERDDLIHEDPVTWRQWSKAIAASGLRPSYFVPHWFLDQSAHLTRSGSLPRFGRLAKSVGPALRVPFLQESARLLGGPLGRQLLGLPLNVVLWKD